MKETNGIAHQYREREENGVVEGRRDHDRQVRQQTGML